MLIFGTDSIPKRSGTGVFYCPLCLHTREYTRQLVRSFLTLYYIPIFPLSVDGEYIECESCQSTYEPKVLEDPRPGATFTPHFKRTILKMMVLVSCADGHVHSSETQEITGICHELLEAPDLAEQLRQQVTAPLRSLNSDAVLNLLTYSRGFLNTVGRQNVFIAALRVARADKQMHAKEIPLLFKIGDALGLRPAHVKEMIEAEG